MGMKQTINRFFKKALLLVAAVCSVSLLWAQSSTVTGVVLDEAGEPVIGAVVMVKGTTQAVVTNVDGRFTIKADQNVTLVVEFIGYETTQVAAMPGKPANVVLKPSATDIEQVEVVAVGYGTQKKESVVGAISTVSPQSLRVPVRSLSQSLAGNVAGLVALQSSGEPGKDDAQFWIRGIATFTGDPNPLVLVDGIERPLENVDPLEIESFSVLKDASATAVYGVRGANGVILINTRRGFDGPAKIDLRYEQGFSFASKRLEFVDAATRSMLYNEAVDATAGSSQTNKFSEAEIEAMRSQVDPELYPDVDWQKLLMRDVSLSEKVSANISGGGKFARYFTALSFYNQDGQYKVNPGQYDWVPSEIGQYGKNINYKRYNFRTNVDMDITTTTVVSVGLQGNVIENTTPVEGSDAIYRDIINAAPNAMPVLFKDGKLAARDGLNNPYSMLTQKGYGKTMGNSLRANLTIAQDLKFITEGLTAKLIYAYDYANTTTETRQRGISFWEASGRDEFGELVRQEYQKENHQDVLNYGQSSAGSRDQYLELTINYAHKFGKHDVGALVMGFTKDHRNISNGLSYMNALPNRSIGLAGRVTYGYDNRYLVEANIGFNGSENFAKGNRMGIFPAIALGWVASEEAFLRDSQVLTWAKIRASVGQVGNDQIGSQRFVYLSTVREGLGGYSGFGVNFNRGESGIGEGRMANENLTWEVATKYNLGIELGFWDAFKLNGDIFYERRENIFLNPQVSEVTGLPISSDTKPYANMGVMENKGFEISAEYGKQINKDWFVSVRGNFTFTRNEVVENGQFVAYPWQDQKGVRYGLTLGYRAMHLFSQEEIDALPDYYTVFSQAKDQLRAGDIRYEDLNDDGKITEADRTWIGNPSMPEIVYGFGASAKWKNLDFSFLFQGAANRSSYLTGGWYFQPFQADRGPKWMGNVMTIFMDRWTPENQNPHAFSPRLSEGPVTSNYQTSTWWQRDSGYIRLKNLELGYTLPQKWANKIHCGSMRFYVQGVNLFTISPFISDFWDPETGAATYPMQRQVFVGVNLTF